MKENETNIYIYVNFLHPKECKQFSKYFEISAASELKFWGAFSMVLQ